ncbi:hypothetical protein ATJ97_2918 [Georgenia soli]|uniref:Uncharacterized protein n=1 Tax=Georgenia soli TaxID=638953 RepID=A0A2A9EQ73_9MICO|nr:hypothetical protein [Georgenia soli]PFG40390.1 hypothetical protein ATJ97_2918 [Georgenia soli]
MAVSLLLLVLVPVALGAVLATWVARLGHGSRPENTPSATLAAARRHENATAALGLAGGIAVAVVAVLGAGNGARLVPGAPGLVAALGPACGALVHLAVHAVGESTWPRPAGTVRSAALRRRTVRDLTGARLGLLLATSAVLAVALALFISTADESGRAVPVLITPEDAAAGIGGGASGPYPGTPYAVPLLLALVLVLGGTAWVLHLVARRPAVTGTLREDDLRLRRTSARRVLGGVQLFVGGEAAAAILVAAAALGNAGWSLAAWLAVAVAAPVGVGSLVAAAQAFTPGDPRPGRETVAVGPVRP